ncbi:N-acetylglucosaminylphosphatidylinositol deacetylase [Macrococcoides caseolyticum]|uniref:PIG-L deacetylase family protein n=1 Tax=Macrococcoides caseolyticum TaxID=69966 RepID=UPI000C336DF6|nr:PIG-L family deacetylase [Macrococcus caseolyticus]PKF46212.1 N-acetylglucosaminylphosphatidylinositol deacetylase [Macrococcus caseolyticus]
MSYLVVVAHPDDEALGAGGIIHKLSSQGKEVNVCIISANVTVRQHRPSDDELYTDMNNALDILGVNNRILGEFPNIKLNNVDHLEIVQFIEKAIEDTAADVIITHHPADLNNDHLHVSLACQAASRLYQRRDDIPNLKALYFMEINSSTDWSFNKSLNSFNPNTFIEIGKDGLNRKIQACNEYRNVMRPYPHPRSEESIKGLSAYRGSQSGLKYAEALECVFRSNDI